MEVVSPFEEMRLSEDSGESYMHIENILNATNGKFYVFHHNKNKKKVQMSSSVQSQV